MAKDYWVKSAADSDETGPYTGAQIRAFAAEGRISPATLISFDRASWHPARRVKDLFPAAASPAPRSAEANHTPPRVTHAPTAPARAATTHVQARSGHPPVDASHPPTGAVRAQPNAASARNSAAPAQTAAAHAPIGVAPAAARRPGAISTGAARSAAHHSAPNDSSAPDYRNAAAGHHTKTPDQRFRGVFLFLYIIALLAGFSFLATGGSQFLPTFRAIGGHYTQAAYISLILPSILLVAGLFFLTAGILGIANFRVEGLLGLAALTMIGTAIANAAPSLFTDVSGRFIETHVDWWRCIVEVERVLFSLTFPLLCLFGAAALRRARHTPEQANAPRSAWAALARGIGAVGFVGGGLLLARHGRGINLYFPEIQRIVRAHGTGFTTMNAFFLHQMLPAIIISALMLFGGFLTLFSKLTGRILVLLAAAGMLAFQINHLESFGLQRMKELYLTHRLADIFPILTFLIFAVIVLLRRGLSKNRG